jgi:hypothetical protein
LLILSLDVLWTSKDPDFHSLTSKQKLPQAASVPTDVAMEKPRFALQS